jgi:hypothetical protein
VRAAGGWVVSAAISFAEGLYVRPDQVIPSLHPRPLDCGFRAESMYRVVLAYNASETSEAYLGIVRDDGALWFIPTRHLRVVGVFPELKDLQVPLDGRIDHVRMSRGQNTTVERVDG